jgi:hypothetical protein
MGYLTPGHPGFEPVANTMIDFLRAALYGDEAARSSMATDGSVDGLVFERHPS